MSRLRLSFKNSISIWACLGAEMSNGPRDPQISSPTFGGSRADRYKWTYNPYMNCLKKMGLPGIKKPFLASSWWLNQPI